MSTLQDAVDGCVTYSLDDGRTRFFDLLQMVEFYQLNRGTLSHRLTHYIINKETATALGYDVTKKPAQKISATNCSGASDTNAAASAASPGLPKNGSAAPLGPALPLQSKRYVLLFTMTKMSLNSSVTKKI